jgi:hypothetical protein
MQYEDSLLGVRRACSLHMLSRMKLIGLLVVALVGCYSQPPPPEYPQPEEVSGPPGGGMDGPTYAQYEADSQPANYADPSQGYIDPGVAAEQPVDGEAQAVEPEASADPQDPGYAMGPVTDPEIDATLDGYGEWVEDEDYGRVWRPYATVVGVDFTPYESCGSWVWTDWGWTYTCDWDWGWLPFHYGRWDWFDDGGYWGWVPGYEWGPGWVDWRHGGGYVGWRPTPPLVRDHRDHHHGPTFHDHRHGVHDSHWKFVADNDFGKGHIRPHLYKDLAEGLRVTTPVVRPAIKGTTQPVHVAATMRARLANPVWRQQHGKLPVANQRPAAWRQPQPQTGWRQPPRVQQPQTGWRQPPQRPQTGWRQPPQRPQTWQVPQSRHPVWRDPAPSWRQPPTAVRQPTPRPYNPGPRYNPPARSWNSSRPAPAYNPPSRPSYNPPSRPSYNPPSRPSYNPPSRPSYSPPSHSYSAPSHSYSAPSHSYSAPSHSYGGGGGGHSYGGGGGHSYGGGGRHR